MTNKYHLTPIQVLSTFSEYSLPKNFCIVPFTNIILNPDGDVSICRQKGTKHVVGSLKENTVEEIWNNEYLKKWRSEFLSGNVEICRSEIQSDACNIGSGSYFYINKAHLDIEQKNLPIKLTANFNGKCNLKCKMCDVWTLSNGFYDQINYWDELREKFFPFIEEVEMLSGEPFIQADTWRLIQEVSIVNPNCIWSFTTNGHYELSEQMIYHLNKIKIKNIIISLETLNAQKYSEIRIGGKLERVMRTLSQFKDYNKKRLVNEKISINIHFLVMEDNWIELDNIIKYCDENEFMLILNCLVDPPDQSLANKEYAEKIKIVENIINTSTRNNLSRKVRVLFFLTESLTNIDKAYYLDRIRQLIRDEK